VLRSKLRIETRMRLLKAWDPSRYGEKREVKVDATVTTTTRHVVDVRALTDAQRQALLDVLQGAVDQGLIAPPDDPDVIDVADDAYHIVMDDDEEA